MVFSAACECGAEQIVDHVVFHCPIHRPPRTTRPHGSGRWDNRMAAQHLPRYLGRLAVDKRTRSNEIRSSFSIILQRISWRAYAFKALIMPMSHGWINEDVFGGENIIWICFSGTSACAEQLSTSSRIFLFFCKAGEPSSAANLSRFTTSSRHFERTCIPLEMSWRFWNTVAV